MNLKENNSIMLNAWCEMYRYRKEMMKRGKYDIFCIDYWTLVQGVETDLEIGVITRKNEDMNDTELIEEF